MKLTTYFSITLAAIVGMVAAPTNAATSVHLAVPYTTEIPNGSWTGPWKNSCEEASMVMVNQFYLGQKAITKKQAIALLNPVFTWENKTFGFNANTNATNTARMINDYSSLTATIVRNPTLDQIKAELDAGHPVITFNNGKILNNPLIPFVPGASYYHVMTVIGYDDAKQAFITNDSGNDVSGQNFRYSYQTIMDSLADYSYTTNKTVDLPTVIFTAPKVIVHAPDSHRIYLVENGQKEYISSPNVFGNHNWSWSIVTTMPAAELAALPTGQSIDT